MKILKINLVLIAFVMVGLFSSCKNNETPPSEIPESQMMPLDATVDSTDVVIDSLEHDSITNPAVRSGI